MWTHSSKPRSGQIAPAPPSLNPDSQWWVIQAEGVVYLTLENMLDLCHKIYYLSHRNFVSTVLDSNLWIKFR